LRQAEAQMLDFVGAWEKGSVNERQELAKAVFPDGLVFSHQLGFFEPANTAITDMLLRYLQAVRDGKDAEIEIGAGLGTILNRLMHARAVLYEILAQRGA
jgi:hypothetical protein